MISSDVKARLDKAFKEIWDLNEYSVQATHFVILNALKRSNWRLLFAKQSQIDFLESWLNSGNRNAVEYLENQHYISVLTVELSRCWHMLQTNLESCLDSGVVKLKNDIIYIDDATLRLNYYRNWGSDERHDYRPYCEIIVYGRHGKLYRIYCLIDTGADYTTLNLSIARQLGFDIENDAIEKQVTTANGDIVSVYRIEGITINVSGHKITTAIDFCNSNLPLLGRYDAVRSMDVGFNKNGWFGYSSVAPDS